MAVIIKILIITYHHPISTKPNPGIVMLSCPSFAKNHHAPAKEKSVNQSIFTRALIHFLLPVFRTFR